MRIQKQDLFYGPVLQQIAEYPVFTEINRITEKPGLYLINGWQQLLIKYSAEAGPEWSFSFSSGDLELFQNYECHVALNCGNDAICLLSQEELFKLVDSGVEHTQAVKVNFREGGSMRVRGPGADLNYTIAHNAFPGAMLGSVAPEQHPHAKPEFSQLTVYRDLPRVMFSTTDRMEDLADRLGHHVDENGLTVYLGLSTLSHKWPTWTNDRLKSIEQQIRYDLGFDGYKVKIERHTRTIMNPKAIEKHWLGSDEFLWKLTIHEQL
ncbi:MAG: hypothetical protein ACOH2K_01525 [Burkholderiaceae bacterium]